MPQKNDFFQKKRSHTKPFKRKSSPSYLRIRILLGLLILTAGSYGVYRLFFAEANLSNTETNDGVSPFSLGQEIALQGTLKADGNILTHTHTITDPVYGIISVKSDETINLGNYEGFVETTGIVEKFYQGAPIVKLTALSGQKVGVNHEPIPDIVLEGSAGVYLLQAGIHFLPAFFEEFLLLNEGENGEIKISDLETDQELTLNYFRCNPSNPDKNCKGLVTTFSNSATRSFTTANGDSYYKLNEANSRFVANGDRRGVFINDIPEETVMKLKDLIVFVNAKVMKDRVNFAAPRICQNTEEKLQTIASSSLALKQEGLVASIQGQGLSHRLECSVQVDFSLPTKGKLLTLTTSDTLTTTGSTLTESITTGTNTELPLSGENKWPENATSETTSTTTTPLQRDPNVPQFPLNEEKGLTYTSNRGGYSLKFPSANISYAISMVRENFGQASVYCNSVINVIKYSDKENLETSPAIRIYECESNGSITTPGDNYLITQGANKTFIVQINDPARINFSNKLSFSTL